MSRLWPSFLSSRRGQGAFNRPSCSETLQQPTLGQPGVAFPFTGRHSLPSVLNVARVAFVVGLDPARGPSAVARSVVAIVVDAIKFAVARPRPHIAKEGNKGAAPLLSHLDAAPAVPIVMRVAGVIATMLGARPRHVLGRVRMPVRAFARRRGFAFIAATARSAASAQVLGEHRDDAPACTTTDPDRSAAVVSASMRDSQASKRLTAEIDKSRHFRRGYITRMGCRDA